MKQIKALIFDVDGTLSPPGQPIQPDISSRFIRCLNYIDICILTAQKLEQTKRQVLEVLYGVKEEQLTHLHLFNTQGTQAYRYNAQVHSWVQIYSYPIPHEDVKRIMRVIENAAKQCNLWNPETLAPDNEYFDNRESQITFAGLGKKAEPEAKRTWDPDKKKRAEIVRIAKKLAPEYEYRIGGTTSIDITIPGMNKAFGLDRILDYLHLTTDDVVYIGDEVAPGGNDYPIVFNGDPVVRTVNALRDTLYYLTGFYDGRRGMKRPHLQIQKLEDGKKEKYE